MIAMGLTLTPEPTFYDGIVLVGIMDGEAALKPYLDQPTDIQTALMELLTDLRHWAKHWDVDFEMASLHSYVHHRREREGR